MVLNIPTTKTTNKTGGGAITYYPYQTAIDKLNNREKEEQNQKKQKITLDESRARQFSILKTDCKNIPFWIPDPVNFKDFDVHKIIDRYSYCKSLHDTIKLSNTLNEEHRDKFKQEYKYHSELHDETLNRHHKEWMQGTRPIEFVKPTCCFNHYFGLVAKRDNPNKILPVFDYELHIVYHLDHKNFVTLFASRGLGKTHTIVVRYTNWRILRSNEWDNQDVLLTTGLTQANSTELLNKIENMYIDSFPSLNLDFAGTEMLIDKTRLIAFPAENLKKMRLYDKVAAILVDEADFFSLKDQQRLQEVVFGYVAKSRPLICFFSTPDKPNGFLMQARKKWLEKKKKGDII